MQDTPEFPNYQQRFNSHAQDQVQGSAPLQFAINTAETVLLSRVYELLSLYFSNSTFREKLTFRFRQATLEPIISNILNTLDQVIATRSNGTFPGNRQGLMDSLQDQGGSLEQQLTPYLVRGEFVATLNNAVEEITNTLGVAKEQGQQADSEIKQTLTKVQNTAKKVFQLADLTSSTALGDYFHRAYNGRSIAEHENWLGDKSKGKNKGIKKIKDASHQLLKNHPYFCIAFVTITALLLATCFLLLRHPVKEFFSHPELLSPHIDFIRDIRWWFLTIPLLPAGALTYMKFNHFYPGGYARSAALWFSLLFGTIIATTAFVVHRASQLVNSLSVPHNSITNPLELVLANALILAIPAYAIRVCLVNYNAAKHQAVLNLHRANVLRTFPLILEGADDPQARSVVYAALAESVFKPGATGHINRGQATDNASQNLFKEFLS